VPDFAFIFARGGSKGLPGKNIKPLMGKPLIQYSIETALSSTAIDKVFVSTDDLAIAEVGKRAGATIIMRPDHLATDESPEWQSWRHAVDWVTPRYGDFEHFVSLPATSPLRRMEDLENALKKFKKENADVCIAITPSDRSPFFNMVTRDGNGMVHLAMTGNANIFRRQDAPCIYDITTVVYVTTPAYILEHDGLFSGSVTSIQVPKERAIDIDDIYDFMMAETILQGN